MIYNREGLELVNGVTILLLEPSTVFRTVLVPITFLLLWKMSIYVTSSRRSLEC